MSRKKWITAHIDKEIAAQVAENHSLDPFTALIVVSRGITEYEDVEEFFETDFSFCDPYLIVDMEKCVDRINLALEKGERICVFGDYDADGVTATALMYSYLSNKGADVMYYIPDRVTEGYGMNCSAIDKLNEQGVKLIVTVDNGISAIEEIDYANSLGIETVVTDHHQVGETLPNAVAVIDPHREDCNVHFKEWAGVGVAFKVVCALEKGDYSEILNEYADIIAVGTVADVVDLKDENRAIVKYGVAKINSNPCNGINALRQVAGVGERNLNAIGVTYSLAPRINAAGRMESATTALKLLLCDNLVDALDIAEKDKGDMELLLRSVPYVIWSNHINLRDETAEENISLHFMPAYVMDVANVRMNTYFETANELRKNVPVLTSYNVYIDNEGNYYRVDEESIYKDQVDCYLGLAYANMKKQDFMMDGSYTNKTESAAATTPSGMSYKETAISQ